MKRIGQSFSKFRFFVSFFLIFILAIYTSYALYYYMKSFGISYIVCLIVSFVLFIPTAYYEIKAGCNYWTLKNEKLIYMHPVHFMEVFKYLFGAFHGIQMDVKDIESCEIKIRHGRFFYGHDTYGLELYVMYKNNLYILPMNYDSKQRLDMVKMMDKLSELNPNIKFIDSLNVKKYLENEEVYTNLRDAFNKVMETKIRP